MAIILEKTAKCLQTIVWWFAKETFDNLMKPTEINIQIKNKLDCSLINPCIYMAHGKERCSPNNIKPHEKENIFFRKYLPTGVAGAIMYTISNYQRKPVIYFSNKALGYIKCELKCHDARKVIPVYEVAIWEKEFRYENESDIWAIKNGLYFKEIKCDGYRIKVKMDNKSSNLKVSFKESPSR